MNEILLKAEYTPPMARKTECGCGSVLNGLRPFAEGVKHHDYDVAWDYEPDDDPPEKSVATIARLRKDIDCDFGEGWEIQYVKNLPGNHLARYIFGTESYPVIALDAEAVENGVRRFKIERDTAFRTTIVHELAHAMDNDASEEEVELVAYEYERLCEGDDLFGLPPKQVPARFLP